MNGWQLAFNKGDDQRLGQESKPNTTEARAKRKTRNSSKSTNAREQLTPVVAAPAARLTTSIPPPEGMTNRVGMTRPKHTNPKVFRYN